MESKKKKIEKSEEALLTFLKRTKAGKYTKIAPGVSVYEHPETLREGLEFEEEEAFYYSTR